MNKEIHDLLKMLILSNTHEVNEKGVYSFSTQEDFSKYRTNLNVLVKDNYITYSGNKSFVVTPLGYEVAQYDSWDEYNTKMLEEKSIELERKDILHQKNVLDLQLKKWQKKTFWWFFSFAIIGFGLSIYNFINSLSTETNKDQTESKQAKTESEQSKPHTLPLNQKKVDSLHNPNSHKKEPNLSKTQNDSKN